MAGAETTERKDWDLRLAEVCAADGDKWDRLSDAYDADWKSAYRAEFRRFATERGWAGEHIESGWLDDMPDEALRTYERGSDPAEAARRDAPMCEEPVDG